MWRALLVVPLAACFMGPTGVDRREQISTSTIIASYTHEHDLGVGSATLGPTAPTWVDTAAAEFAGLAFDADAETAHILWEQEACWDAASDLMLEIYWSNESGAALASGETVKWDITWRAKAVGEDLNAGTATAASVTYTAATGFADGLLVKSQIVIDYDAAANPIAAEDLVSMEISRDMTGDSYASDAVVTDWHIDMTANKICSD